MVYRCHRFVGGKSDFLAGKRDILANQIVTLAIGRTTLTVASRSPRRHTDFIGGWRLLYFWRIG